MAIGETIKGLVKLGQLHKLFCLSMDTPSIYGRLAPLAVETSEEMCERIL